ncbi:MAG: hypothetical protein ABW169_08595 [Sphingobium sp.]
MQTDKLSQDDVEALCLAGETAWNKLGPRHKEAKFTWRGTSYVAKRTSMKLSIETRGGHLVIAKAI